jgi:hypothetical protein
LRHRFSPAMIADVWTKANLLSLSFHQRVFTPIPDHDLSDEAFLQWFTVR